ERRQSVEMLLFIFGIYGLFVLYFLFDQVVLPREWIPAEWNKTAKAVAIGMTLVAVAVLIARSVLAAGQRAFAVEKYEGKTRPPKQKKIQLYSLAYLLVILGLLIFFWFGYEHNDVLWISFTRDYVNLKVPFVHHFTGKENIAPDQLQFLNALFVIILVP